MDAEAAYLFRHALVREAAYELQLPTDRACLHAFAVRILEADALASPLDLADHASQAARSQQDVIENSELTQIELAALQRGADVAARQYDTEAELECLRRLSEHPALPEQQRVTHLLDQYRPLLSLGRIEQSIQTCKTAAKRANADLAARAYAHLCETNRSVGRISAARDALNHALEVRTKDTGTLALLQLYEGRLALQGMDLTKAEECLRTSESLAREAGDDSVASTAMGVLAILYRTREEYSVALEWLDKLDAMSLQNPERRSHATHNSRGSILWRLGRWDEAQLQFELSLQTARQRGNIPEQAVALGNLGNVYMERERVEESRDCLEQAIGMCQELGLASHRAIYTMALGNCYRKLGNEDQALEQYNEAETLHRAVGNQDELSGAIANKGLIYMDAGRYADALREFERAEAIARETGNALRVSAHIARRAELCKLRGDFDGAATAYTEALNIRRIEGAEIGRTDALLQIQLTWSLSEFGQEKAARSSLTKAREYAEQCSLGQQDVRATTTNALRMLSQLEEKLGAG